MRCKSRLPCRLTTKPVWILHQGRNIQADNCMSPQENSVLTKLLCSCPLSIWPHSVTELAVFSREDAQCSPSHRLSLLFCVLRSQAHRVAEHFLDLSVAVTKLRATWALWSGIFHESPSNFTSMMQHCGHDLITTVWDFSKSVGKQKTTVFAFLQG